MVLRRAVTGSSGMSARMQDRACFTFTCTCSVVAHSVWPLGWIFDAATEG